jgi:hypothetical protein
MPRRMHAKGRSGNGYKRSYVVGKSSEIGFDENCSALDRR